MTTPENTLQYAIDSMERASKELSSLADSLPVGEGMEAFDVHSLRTALEFIAEGLLTNALQSKSVLDKVEAARDECGMPYGVTIPSPAASGEFPWDTPSSGVHSSDFGEDSEPAWSYHPSSDSDD
jgi:hypothetical protein